jgi:hypothetical protein
VCPRQKKVHPRFVQDTFDATRVNKGKETFTLVGLPGYVQEHHKRTPPSELLFGKLPRLSDDL